jgi:prephenate dehydrogenase
MDSASTPETPVQPVWLPRRIIIWGVGLLGGSVALASRAVGFQGAIVGVGRNAETLESACKLGIITEYVATTERVPQVNWQSGDLLLLCQPVAAIVDCLPELLNQLPEGVLVSDVGSTKRTIVAAAESAITARAVFVGSHPMAGSEKTGFQHASAKLFHNATTLVCPTNQTNPQAVAHISAFWEALGSRVIWMHPDRHDELIALISHVPHMAATALVTLVQQRRNDPAMIRLLCGNGFRDTTRIAQGSSEVWAQISRENAEPIAHGLEELAGILNTLATSIRTGDFPRLQSTLEAAGNLRRLLDREPSGGA